MNISPVNFNCSQNFKGIIKLDNNYLDDKDINVQKLMHKNDNSKNVTFIQQLDNSFFISHKPNNDGIISIAKELAKNGVSFDYLSDADADYGRLFIEG